MAGLGSCCGVLGTRRVSDMAISKTQRWLDLIAFLVRHRFPVDVDQVMNGVPAYREKWNSGQEKDKQTVRRMFERDKDELRSAGIPLETREYLIDGVEKAQGYELAGKDFYLPYLRLVGQESAEAAPAAQRRPGAPGAMELKITGEEAVTAIEALRRVADLPASPFAREARSALRKLGFDLDLAALGESPVVYADQVEASRGVTDRSLSVTEFARPYLLRRDTVGTGGVADTLRLLTRALRERTRVRFHYHGIHRGEATDRDVAPYGLLFQHGQWYLIGSDATREGAIRVFRLGRMEALEVGKTKSPEYEIPDDFDVSDYARRQPWELGDDEPFTARVRFDFPLSLWADRNRHGERVEELPGGATIRRFAVRQTDPFLRWLQQFGGDAVVTHPPGLRQAQAEMARETLEAYGV
jgi:predicted DNA-binding transcriptional regulator YafY